MSKTVLKVENLYKRYRLGIVNHTALIDDLRIISSKILGKPNPTETYVTTNDLANAKQGKITARYIWSLQDINLEVIQGEILGVIGKNGAGKSTLLKILSKTTAPTKGNIKIKGKVASLLEVGTGFHSELTGRENIYLNGMILGMKKREIDKKLDEIVDFAGVETFLDTPVKRYSSGMMVRLGFAVAAHLEPDILIVDEVLAVGDVEFQRKAIGKMKDVSEGDGRTVLFVSHNMRSVKNLCSRGILLKNGKVDYEGDIHNVVQTYLIQNQNQQEAIRGIIPSDIKRLGSGDVRLKSVLLMNQENEEAEFVHYKENIRFEIELEAYKNINSAVISIILLNHEKEKVGMLLSREYETDTNHFSFTKGSHKVAINLKNNLFPGEYYITLSVSEFPSGSNIDIVENILKFKVLHLAIEKEKHFKWTNHGYLFLNGEIIKQ